MLAGQSNVQCQEENAGAQAGSRHRDWVGWRSQNMKREGESKQLLLCCRKLEGHHDKLP